jgi:hypothetical protein
VESAPTDFGFSTLPFPPLPKVIAFVGIRFRIGRFANCDVLTDIEFAGFRF